MTPDAVERERGTLRETLPKRPSIIVALFIAICTASATYLCYYASIGNDEATTWESLAVVAVITCLGALSAVAGIVYSSSSIHSISYGIAAFLAFIVSMARDGTLTIETVIPALKVVAAPLQVGILASSSITRSLLSILPSDLLLNSLSMVAGCVLPFLSILVVSTNTSDIPFDAASPTISALVSLTLLLLYHINRSHKNGSLTIDPGMNGITIATGLGILASIQVAIGTGSSAIIIPFLIGSLMAVLLAATFASVADVWYGVGSGQFQMISVDTAGIIFYFFLPFMVLLLRFVDRFGDGVSDVWNFMSQSVFGGIDITNNNAGMDPEQTLLSGMAILIGAVTLIGVPLLNAYAPLTAYLVSRAYTHGQPNRRRNAICVDFVDLFGPDSVLNEKSNMARFLADLNSASKEKPVLNVFCTGDDFRESHEIVQELVNAGHFVGITSKKGNSSAFAIKESYLDYCRTLGTKPTWYHVNGIDVQARQPSTLQMVSTCGMKVAFWSTLLNLNKNVTGILSISQEDALERDLGDKLGGSIIYVTGSRDPTILAQILCEIVRKVSDIKPSAVADDHFVFSALSDAVKDDASMNLS
uniref:Uncharacterized protein n=1 Tax=Attheya septentrionalis TaxID=420275 RepID=A0A7S2U916_9STRA|mmetsp:Transcript_13892/g.25136  ORF Transcript_13892/g.25136 Transcript_13892/m.25136 type:complete len:588 (+) Transcript_13892:83-1846(+)